MKILQTEVYAKNLKLLRAKDPALAAMIEQADESESCYGKAREAKDGNTVAVFTDGAALFSLYNPGRDAALFAAEFSEASPQFCLVGGLGSAQHIHEILKAAPELRVVAAEKNAASLKTLFAQNDFEPLLSNPSFFLTLPCLLSQTLCSLYIPALFPRFKTVFLRPWSIHNAAEAEQIRSTAGETLRTIAADYSVQAHFGKIWMRNILQNLQTASKLPDSSFCFPVEKTAHIVAAGPSLDDTLSELKKKRSGAYIIATDTALQTLAAFGVDADAAVTIDGQNISYLHFFSGLKAETLLVADLCAHPAAVKAALEHGCRVLFTQSAHPLCRAAAEYQKEQTGKNPFLDLDVSSGTVTAAAADFAVKAGFKNIVLHGADFAYRSGKPYARGTYLDALYASQSNRLHTLEQQFAALMYRTPLVPAGQSAADGVTNETFQSYARALCDFMVKSAEKGVKIRRQKDTGIFIPSVFTEKNDKNEKKISITQYSYLFSGFLCRFIQYTEKAEKNREAVPVFLLPFAAWLQQKNIPQDVLKLAKSMMERYNKTDYV